jgi:predicted DNA-binding transcriptional regulator YafY
MPARLRHRIDTLQVTAVPRPAVRLDSGVLVALSAAVHACEVLRFDYAGSAAPRRVQPHHVVTWGGRWYLVAWDLDRDDWRTFRADRITPRTPTGPRFIPRELPGGDVATYIAGKFQNAGDLPCRGEVILDLPAEAVSRYAGDGLVEALGPDRCRVVLGSWSWAGLAAGLGRFDADVEVVGPVELKEAFAHLARRYADAAGV